METRNQIFVKSSDFKSEYSASVIKVGELQPIEGSDFLAKTLVFGTQIVVRKDQIKEGDILLYAANETQLNEKFLSVNNLFEISCRDKNANADEVNAIMAEYEPIRKQADKLKNDAKNVKASIDQLKKRSDKCLKEIKKKEKELESIEDETKISSIKAEIDALRNKSDELLSRAMEKTTVYTELKKQNDDMIASGKHIVDEAKKKVGFFNKYGRVRCITLKNTPSFGFLFTPNELFKYDSSITMEDVEAYVGEEFDTINGELFVKAYVPPVPKENVRRDARSKAQKKVERFDRMIEGEFFFHYQTDQLNKAIQFLKPDDVVDISCKLHGTSICLGNLQVNKPIKLPIHKKLFNMFVDKTGLFKSRRITDYEIGYGPVYSSRTVIKNRYINKTAGGGFYDSDIWTEYGDIVYPYLDKGMTIYGEICGYLTGSQKMIQKFYNYGCKEGENILMIYRISTSNEDGTKREWEVPEVLEWTKQLIERMKENNDKNYKRIHPIDLFYHGTLEDLYPDVDTSSHWHENVLERLKNDKEHFGMEMNEPLNIGDVPREGIVLRKNGDNVLRAYKLKTTSFIVGESVRMDAGDVDMEMIQVY